MITSEMIKMLCKEQNISLAELARRIGQTRQNFYKKMKRSTLTTPELEQIAAELGARYEQSFTLADGRKLKLED